MSKVTLKKTIKLVVSIVTSIILLKMVNTGDNDFLSVSFNDNMNYIKVFYLFIFLNMLFYSINSICFKDRTKIHYTIFKIAITGLLFFIFILKGYSSSNLADVEHNFTKIRLNIFNNGYIGFDMTWGDLTHLLPDLLNIIIFIFIRFYYKSNLVYSLPLLIEFSQMFFKVGVYDVQDLYCNYLGLIIAEIIIITFRKISYIKEGDNS